MVLSKPGIATARVKSARWTSGRSSRTRSSRQQASGARLSVVPAGQFPLGTVIGSPPSRSRTAGWKRPPGGGSIGPGVLSAQTRRSAGVRSISENANPIPRASPAINALMFFRPLEVNCAKRAGTSSS